MVLLLGPHTAAGPPFIPGPDPADKMGGKMNMFILGIIYLFVYLKLHFCCLFVLWILKKGHTSYWWTGSTGSCAFMLAHLKGPEWSCDMKLLDRDSSSSVRINTRNFFKMKLNDSEDQWHDFTSNDKEEEEEEEVRPPCLTVGLVFWFWNTESFPRSLGEHQDDSFSLSSSGQQWFSLPWCHFFLSWIMSMDFNRDNWGLRFFRCSSVTSWMCRWCALGVMFVEGSPLFHLWCVADASHCGSLESQNIRNVFVTVSRLTDDVSHLFFRFFRSRCLACWCLLVTSCCQTGSVGVTSWFYWSWCSHWTRSGFSLNSDLCLYLRLCVYYYLLQREYINVTVYSASRPEFSNPACASPVFRFSVC